MFTIEKRISKVDVWIDNNTKRYIICHHTASSPKTTFQGIINFFNKKDEISIHFVVGSGGEVVQLADENDRCLHAGKSDWQGRTTLNNHSIGIEVLSDGQEFSDVQIEATTWLIKDIMARNHLTPDKVLRHLDIAIPKGRKSDIGQNFYKKWGTWENFQNSLRGVKKETIRRIEEAKLKKLSKKK